MHGRPPCLPLNEAKTKTVNAFKESFDFLGFTIRMGQGKKSGKYYANVQPSKRALRSIKDRVTELTVRKATAKPLAWVVRELNSTVRGWVGHYHYRNCSMALTRLRHHVEERLRTHLRKRHKVKARAVGYARFSSRVMYHRFGLYKVPTTAGWTRAHALK